MAGALSFCAVDVTVLGLPTFLFTGCGPASSSSSLSLSSLNWFPECFLVCICVAAFLARVLAVLDILDMLDKLDVIILCVDRGPVVFLEDTISISSSLDSAPVLPTSFVTVLGLPTRLFGAASSFPALVEVLCFAELTVEDLVVDDTGAGFVLGRPRVAGAAPSALVTLGFAVSFVDAAVVVFLALARVTLTGGVSAAVGSTAGVRRAIARLFKFTNPR